MERGRRHARSQLVSYLPNHAASATAHAEVWRSASLWAHHATARSSVGSHSTFAGSRITDRTVRRLPSWKTRDRPWVHLWHRRCSTESRHVALASIEGIRGARQKMRGGVSRTACGAPKRTEWMGEGPVQNGVGCGAARCPPLRTSGREAHLRKRAISSTPVDGGRATVAPPRVAPRADRASLHRRTAR